MSENLRFPNEFFPALEYLAQTGPVFAQDVESIGIPYSHFLWLKDNGYAKMVTPDPNFLYQMPEDRWHAYQFKISRKGITAYHLLKEARDEREKQAIQHAADRVADRAHADENTQKQFKHDWRIAIFNVTAGFILGAIADHFLDIVGNAVRLWLALKHVFLN